MSHNFPFDNKLRIYFQILYAQLWSADDNQQAFFLWCTS